MRHPIFSLSVATTIAFSFIHLTSAAEPKKLLVVTVTTGFRHSSIATGEKILQQLADQTHEFTLDLVQQPSGKPTPPKKVPALKADATAEEKSLYDSAKVKLKGEQDAYRTAEKEWEPALVKALEKLNPASLKNYDGVIFENTTGDLPIPDKEGFLAWIKAGHAFIGMHSASDTFHGWPGYLEMLGGEFKGHGAQVGIEPVNKDSKHPATAHLGATWAIQQEEVYQFKNYDPAKVHELLVLDQHPNDKTPGHFPVSWCREYGAGKVFYTSLGHREDIWDTDAAIKERKNPVEVGKAYQAHILGGIEWALGLKPGDAAPQK